MTLSKPHTVNPQGSKNWRKMKVRKRSYLWLHRSVHGCRFRVGVGIRLGARRHWRLLWFGLSRLRRTLDVLPISLVRLWRSHRRELQCWFRKKGNKDRSGEGEGLVSRFPHMRDAPRLKSIRWCRQTTTANILWREAVLSLQKKLCLYLMLEGRQNHKD